MTGKLRRSKIAFICTYSTPLRTYRMARALAGHGYEVYIIEWDRSGSKLKIEKKDGIIYRRLTLKAPFGILLFFLLPLWHMYIFIQTLVNSYQIVQPQNLDCLLPIIFSSKLLRKRKIVYDLADFYADAYVNNIPLIRNICALTERILIKCFVDCLILVSEKQLSQVGFQNVPGKVIIIYNSPDASEIAMCMSLDNEESEKVRKNGVIVLLYAGVLPLDRVRLLLNVYKAINGLPVKLLIAGYGEFESFFKKINLERSSIKFLGSLPHEEVLKLSKIADAIILPYDPVIYNNRIGLPNKLFDAMATGSIILAPANTYMGQITSLYNIGFIVDYNDINSIRNALKNIMNLSTSTREEIKKRARKVFEEKFSFERLKERYIKTITEVMRNK